MNDRSALHDKAYLTMNPEKFSINDFEASISRDWRDGEHAPFSEPGLTGWMPIPQDTGALVSCEGGSGIQCKVCQESDGKMSSSAIGMGLCIAGFVLWAAIGKRKQ